MLEGDSITDPASQRVVLEPRETDAIRQEKEKEKAEEEIFRKMVENLPLHRPFIPFGSHLRFDLEQLAQGSATPLLAILPPDEQDRYATPVGKAVQQFLDRLEGNHKSYFYKWRNGVLLVNYPSWFTEPVSVIPYSLLHSLHLDRRGHVPLPEWAELMRAISDDQAQWFAANNDITNLKQLRPCLLFVAKYPRVQQPDGDSIDRETVQYLQSVLVLMPGAMLSEPQPRIRIREEAVKNLPQIASWLHIEGYNAEQRKSATAT